MRYDCLGHVYHVHSAGTPGGWPPAHSFTPGVNLPGPPLRSTTLDYMHDAYSCSDHDDMAQHIPVTPVDHPCPAVHEQYTVHGRHTSGDALTPTGIKLTYLLRSRVPLRYFRPGFRPVRLPGLSVFRLRSLKGERRTSSVKFLSGLSPFRLALPPGGPL